MKEKKTESEKTIVIDIKLTRGLVVALSCVLVSVGLLAYLTLTGQSAAAAETETAGEALSAQSTGMRQFYLTQSTYSGTLALTACAPGYHMASIWEIADPSNLKYNTSLGITRADSGQGPLAGWAGWVRTGYAANSGSPTAIAGRANCNAWGSDSFSDTGTMVGLSTDWSSTDEDVGVWEAGYNPCSLPSSVWCIED